MYHTSMLWLWRIPVLMPCVHSGVAQAKFSGITSKLPTNHPLAYKLLDSVYL
jgi:hypothetical protein